ncbi:PAS domain S-box protein [Pseudoxanthomonas daejeonensis]|uniref:PAS domain S-box protein n=1 Tax=Pseudoxanthomonas daejeonensis TaxID=266062 RepID=UPI001F5484BC|nr:PAS domain S-box protein [Pseudoxanthomonas daejeonensis]UNK57310.1 PAS domain S-box protein [Pseudoxanthomonas daejeonensis]
MPLVESKARGLVWRIALFYVLLGICWILFSDQLIASLFADVRTVTRLQSWKGVVYMVGTGLLLYLLLRPLVDRLLLAQQRLVNSESRYREMFEASPSPMWTYDLETMRILDSNPAASSFLGWSRGELRGMEMHMLWPSESREYYDAGVAAIRAAPDQPYARIERLRTSDGSHRDVEMRSSELVFVGGNRIRLIVTFDRTLELQSQRSREQAMARLQEAQRLARLGSFEIDSQTRRGHFSPILQHLLGQAGGDDRARALQDVLVAADPVNQARLDQLLDELASGQAQKMDVLLPFIGTSGQERLLRLRVQAVDEDRRRLLRGTAQDVTEEQQTRRLLGEREQQFAELMRILPDGVMILSGEHVIYANPACAGLFARQSERLLGEPLSALVDAPDLVRLREYLQSGVPGEEPSPCMRREDGSTFRVALSCSDARYGGQQCKLLVMRDLSEPERMRYDLANSNQELQAMGRQLFTAQEDERRAISRELHDDIGQAITAMKLSAYAAMGEADADRRQEDLHALAETADTTLDKLRNLSMLLRPPQLDALGLEAALRWHAGTLMRNSPVHLELDIQALPQRPEREVEQACFRIAQEGLTNVLRHARARSVSLALEDGEGTCLRLRIEDDGRGFEPADASGLGLVIMRERAQSVGGQLRIDALPGRGTRIHLQLPYAQQATS